MTDYLTDPARAHFRAAQAVAVCVGCLASIGFCKVGPAIFDMAEGNRASG